MTAFPASASHVPKPLPRLGWRIFAVLWLLGLPGISALAWAVLAPWLAAWAFPLTPVLANLAGIVVLSALLAPAVAVGVSLGPSVGLSAPLLTTWVAGRSAWRALRFLLLPGVAGGVAGAAWLVTLAMLWPEGLPVADPVYAMPLVVKLLYGGITEELVMRFGGLTLVMWVLWRMSGQTLQRPGWRLGWCAVLLSALLCGLAQLPVAVAMAGGLTTTVAVQVLLCETVYGVMAGFLFWRYGLEAAILAHAIAYLLSHGLI